MHYGYREAVMSQSPGVASTLGKQVLNPERVPRVGRNRVGVESAIQFRNPGLPRRQPWPLSHNRFTVKQLPYYSLIQSVAHPIKQAA